MTNYVKDAALVKTKALPAANASASCTAIDFGTSGPPIGTQLTLSTEALGSLADSKTATYTFNDSADNSSFTAIPELTTVVQTGGGGVGAAAAADRTVCLPPSCRRYVNVSCAVAASGGDNTAKSFTLSAKLP